MWLDMQLNLLVFFFTLSLSTRQGKVYSLATRAAQKVLVVGGSGRVGGSALRSLLQRSKKDESVNIQLTAAGRSVDKWNAYVKSYNIPTNVDFVAVDISRQSEQLDKVVDDYDLIIHTAGPFQQLRENVLLKTVARLGKKYIDVLDDVELSRICRGEEYQSMCKRSGASAVISTGIWYV